MLHTKRKKEIFFLILTLVFSVGFAYIKSTLAAPDAELTYHGKLTDTSNVAVPDGTYDFTLVIYDAPTGGNCLWSAQGNCTTPTAKALTITNGIFSTTLGESGDNPLNLDFSQNYYLGVTIGTNSEMTPRRKITPTGFALNSHRLNGLTADNYIDTSATAQTKAGSLTVNDDFTVNTNDLFVDTSTGRVGIGTTIPQTQLHVVGSSHLQGIDGEYPTYSISSFGDEDWEGAFISLNRARGTTSTPATTINGDTISQIDMWGYDGDSYERAARISTQVAGVVSNGIVPTSISFSTTDTSGSIDTRLFIGNSGNIGIGLPNPIYPLHLYGTTNGGADVYSQTDGGRSIKHWFRNAGQNWSVGQTGTTTSPSYQFRITDESAGQSRLAIDILGNVGIGTTSPDYKLQVAGDIVPETDDTYTLGTSTLRWQDLYLGPNSLHIGTDGDEGTISYDTTNDIFNFNTAAVFGTTANAVTGTIRWTGTDFEGYDGSSWNSLTSTPSPLTAKGDLYTYDTAAARLPVGTNGQILMADSTATTGLKWADGSSGDVIPSFRVHRNGVNQSIPDSTSTVVAWTTEVFDTNNDFASNQFTVTVPGKYLFTGSVGIETITDTSRVGASLRKNGSVIAEGNRTRTGDHIFGTSVFSIVVDAQVGDVFDVVAIQDTGTTQDIYGDDAFTYFSGSRIDGGNGLWTLNSPDIGYTSGNVGIGTTSPDNFGLQVAGNIGPDANNTYDLGSTTNRFQDLYLGSNTLHIGSSATDEGLISYDTTGNILNFTTDATTQGDIAFNTNDLFVDTSSGSVGVGTTNPAWNFHIEDSDSVAYVAVGAPSDFNSRLLFLENGSVAWNIGHDATGNQFNFNDGTNTIFTIENGSPSNRLHIDSTGNIGIGTISPSATLDVTGNVEANTFTENGTALSAKYLGISAKAADADLLDSKDSSEASTASTIVARNSSGDINARLFRSEYDSTNASIGYIMTQIDTATNNYIRPSTPAQLVTGLGLEAGGSRDIWVEKAGDTMTGDLSVNGYVEASNGLRQDGNVILNGTDTWLRTTGDTGWYSATYGGGWYMTDSTYIRNVGSKQLLVNTNIRATRYYDHNDPNYYVDPAATSITNDMRAHIFYDQGNTNYYVNPASTSVLNNLSIGDSGFAQKLSVSNGGISIDDDGDGNWVGIGEYNDVLSFSTNADAAAVPMMILNNSAYLGVGILNPTYRISLPNHASASGRGIANQWPTYSDTRVKSNQKELPYGLDVLLQLTPKSYEHHSSEFVDGELVLGESEKTIGLIAQEVNEIIPEAVFAPEDEDTNLWSLDYDRLVPVTIRAIQQQNTLITQNSNNLTTKATATSLSQLQNLVDTELTNIDTLITTNQQEILTLQEEANTQADIIGAIDLRLTEAETDIATVASTLNTILDGDAEQFADLLAINAERLVYTNKDGSLTFEGIASFSIIVTDEIHTNKLMVNDGLVEENEDGEVMSAASIGEIDTILSEGEDRFSVTTLALEEGAKVFVTEVVEISDNDFYIEKDYDINAFTIVFEKPMKEDTILRLDWLIVGGKM